MFNGKSTYFSIISVYNELISLAFPIIMIAVACAAYNVILDSSTVAYGTLSTQIGNVGDSLSNALNTIMTT